MAVGPRDPRARPGAPPARPREAPQGRHARSACARSSSVTDEEALLAERRLRQADRRSRCSRRSSRRRSSSAGASRSEGALQRLMRLVSRQSKSGVRGVRRRRHAGALREVLQPLPGERIAGFITRGRGVTVHAQDCPKVLETDPAAADRRAVGEREGHAAAGPHRGDVRRPAGTAGRDVEGDQLDGDQHRRAHRCTRSAITRPQNTFELMVASIDELNR